MDWADKIAEEIMFENGQADSLCSAKSNPLMKGKYNAKLQKTVRPNSIRNHGTETR